MIMNFNTFTRYFFYLSLCYHYMNFYYPENTQIFIMTLGYNCMYLYSKSQILVFQLHNKLVKYEKYNQMIDYCKENLKIIYNFICCNSINGEEQNNITDSCSDNEKSKFVLDFVLNNEIQFSCEKDEFLDEIITKKEVNTAAVCDFVIINCEENLKKIVQYEDLNLDETVFQMEPFMHKPILCEFLDHEDKVTKIDFCSNDKSYDFLVIGNCFDKKFLTYFMKNFYDVEVKDNYVLKILDHNVNTLTLESSDVLKLENDGIVKIEIDTKPIE